MANNLTGAAALAYQGTNAASPSNITVHRNRPTANFYQGFSIGDFWVYRPVATSNNNELWVLMGVAGNVANWVLLSTSTGAVLDLQGNTGGPVGPTAGVINIVGTGDISVAGNPGTSTLTISLAGGGNLVSTLTGNSGGAVSPSAGNINVVGDGTTINIVGNPGTHTLTASAIGTGLIQSLTTDDTHVVTPTAGTIIIHGGNNITTAGTAGPNTVTINVSGTTNHALQVGNSTGSLTSLAAATNGQIPIGYTGASPSIANITAGTGISVTNGAGSITITNTAVNPAAGNSFFAYTNNLTAPFSNGLNTVPYANTVFNNGSHYNTGTYTFTAPVAGYYHLTACLNLSAVNYTPTTVTVFAMQFVTTTDIYLVTNASPFADAAYISSGPVYGFNITGSTFCYMNAGDTAYVEIDIANSNETGAPTIDVSGSDTSEGRSRFRSFFSGYQVA